MSPLDSLKKMFSTLDTMSKTHDGHEIVFPTSLEDLYRIRNGVLDQMLIEFTFVKQLESGKKSVISHAIILNSKLNRFSYNNAIQEFLKKDPSNQLVQDFVDDGNHVFCFDVYDMISVGGNIHPTGLWVVVHADDKVSLFKVLSEQTAEKFAEVLFKLYASR